MKLTLTLTLLMLLCFSAFSQTVRIEAENCINNFGLVKEPTQDVGGGLELGYVDAGDWADFTVNPAAAGFYTVSFRIASISASQINVISGSNIIGTMNIPITGGWQTWTTVSTTLSLSAGPQTIRLSFIKNGVNLNWFELTSLNPASSQISTISLTDLKTQVDTLTNTVNSLKALLNKSALSFKSPYLMGSGTTADPYYFIIPALK